MGPHKMKIELPTRDKIGGIFAKGDSGEDAERNSSRGHREHPNQPDEPGDQCHL